MSIDGNIVFLNISYYFPGTLIYMSIGNLHNPDYVLTDFA